MFQTDQPTAVSSIPTPAAAGTQGFFTGGNPGAGQPATVVDADWLNMIQSELVNVVTAAGETPSKTTYNQVLAALKSMFAPVGGIASNVSMTVSAQSATATLTADEIIVETALGGQTYRLASFNQTINLGTTGGGGMDTGAAPNSGFVALYAIYNPTTGAVALLGRNATTVKAPAVYGGANMPAGFTASALVSVWPTGSTGLFGIGAQRGRRFVRPQVNVLSTSTTQASFTSLSIASTVPLNAIACGGQFQVGSTALSGLIFQLAADANGSGLVSTASTINNTTLGSSFSELLIATPQTIFYLATSTGGTPNFTASISQYEF
jgi:hypothetical protein